MCGIAGFLGEWPASSLAGALRSMHLRGPDGVYRHHSTGCQLGATRLAIMDLANGHQPFSDASGEWVCFAAGEIYNAPKLRAELAGHGIKCVTQCDLEVIPHLWAIEGAAAVVKLEGMFAIALWHKSSDELYLIRDATGQKPLYWMQSGQQFGFASEIRGLKAAGVAMDVDTDQLSAFMALRYLPGPKTAFAGIQALAPGHLMQVRRGQPAVLERWDIEGGEGRGPDNLGTIAKKAITQAARADVPMGLYLSGGVDSAFLARVASGEVTDLHALTMTFEGAMSEASGARRLAKELALAHHEVPWCHQSLSRLPELVSRLENPLGDIVIVALDLLAERAAQLGLKVVLSGEGPDEWFFGYGFHRAHQWAQRLSIVPGLHRLLAMLVPATGPLAHRFSGLAQNITRDDLYRIRHWLSSWSKATPRERTDGLRRLFANDEMTGLICTDRLEQWSTDLGQIEPLASTSLEALLWGQCQGWLPGWVSGRQEKIAMAHGVEVRMPLLDKSLRDYALNLPSGALSALWTDKKEWRCMLAAQGHKQTTKPKQAFAPPAIGAVQSETFRALMSDYLNPDSVKRRGWLNMKHLEGLQKRAQSGGLLAAKQISALLILEMWAREFVDKHA